MSRKKLLDCAYHLHDKGTGRWFGVLLSNPWGKMGEKMKKEVSERVGTITRRGIPQRRREVTS